MEIKANLMFTIIDNVVDIDDVGVKCHYHINGNDTNSISKILSKINAQYDGSTKSLVYIYINDASSFSLVCRIAKGLVNVGFEVEICNVCDGEIESLYTYKK